MIALMISIKIVSILPIFTMQVISTTRVLIMPRSSQRPSQEFYTSKDLGTDRQSQNLLTLSPPQTREASTLCDSTLTIPQPLLTAIK